MESTPPVQRTTLASIIDTEKVIAPPRARALLASLAQAKAVPDGPSAVREWSEAIIVENPASTAERAVFATVAGAASAPARRAADDARHIDALRAAAVAMLWGRESAQGPDGQPRFPRLRKLLVDNWDDTRRTCERPEKFMMFFDATMALDRSAEPRVGREGFKTLSLESMNAAKKDVRVGTIGVPFAAIIDTGKFKQAQRAAPAAAPVPHSDPLGTVPRTTSGPPPELVPLPAKRAGSMKWIVIAAIAGIVIAVIAQLIVK